MKTNIMKSFLPLVLFSFIALTQSHANPVSQSDSTNAKKHSEMKMDMKGMKMDMKGTDIKMDSSKKAEKMEENHSSPVLYKGVIDVKSIDDNKDGKVYQCPMDFNVLSDKPGIDPKCGMKLKEVSLQQAKENLIKHGFKVK